MTGSLGIAEIVDSTYCLISNNKYFGIFEFFLVFALGGECASYLWLMSLGEVSLTASCWSAANLVFSGIPTESGCVLAWTARFVLRNRAGGIVSPRLLSFGAAGVDVGCGFGLKADSSRRGVIAFGPFVRSTICSSLAPRTFQGGLRGAGHAASSLFMGIVVSLPQRLFNATFTSSSRICFSIVSNLCEVSSWFLSGASKLSK